VRKKGRRVRLSETQMMKPGMAKTEDGSLVAADMAEATIDLGKEYSHVAVDLKRVSIIAGALLVVVVVLAVALV
jgi:hypothetical protein